MNRFETVPRERLLETIAAACHEVNRAWCRAHGDMSQPHWSDAPEWQRSSAISGVEAALVDPRPEASHESWLRQKVADGWVYGPTKSAENKTHPCMVPFGDLSPEHKEKDSLFVGTVRELANVLGISSNG